MSVEVIYKVWVLFMKKIILCIVALVLVAGGGGAAFLFMQSPAEASLTEEAKEAEQAALDAALADEPGEFVELDPLILPIISKKGVTQVVSLVVSLEVMGPADAERARLLTPRLKDAYIQDMYGVLNDRIALRGGVIRVDMIKKRLNKVSIEVLGEGVVKDVLLQVVQQRPI